MTPIGGFFELELPRAGGPVHPEAHALSTGRACLLVMLQHLKPECVHVPFYLCDAALDPFDALGIPIRYYALDEMLRPERGLAVGEREFLLWVDYFGVCSTQLEELKREFGDRLLIDDTHAFFRAGHAGHWSFTSARKCFGVPDGAYLYAPVDVRIDADRFASPSLAHSALRSLGYQQEAFAAYRAYEQSLPCTIHRISAVSEAMLRSIDVANAAAARRANFDFLHGRLGGSNRFPCEASPVEVPFCYPYLPDKPIERGALHAASIFVPTLWPDLARREESGFEWERRLAADLLPLPVDHRYGPDDLERVVEAMERLR